MRTVSHRLVIYLATGAAAFLVAGLSDLEVALWTAESLARALLLAVSFLAAVVPLILVDLKAAALMFFPLAGLFLKVLSLMKVTLSPPFLPAFWMATPLLSTRPASHSPT